MIEIAAGRPDTCSCIRPRISDVDRCAPEQGLQLVELRQAAQTPPTAPRALAASAVAGLPPPTMPATLPEGATAAFWTVLLRRDRAFARSGSRRLDARDLHRGCALRISPRALAATLSTCNGGADLTAH